MTMEDIFTPYCSYLCGREATELIPLGMAGETPVEEWVCDRCANKIIFGKED